MISLLSAGWIGDVELAGTFLEGIDFAFRYFLQFEVLNRSLVHVHVYVFLTEEYLQLFA